jgi:RNA recognition motif-containing protein
MVATINIVRDRATGQTRGFAFIEMNDDEGARRAITTFDRHEFGGRSLTVNEAKPMAPRGNGGGGGGFNRGRQSRQTRW